MEQLKSSEMAALEQMRQKYAGNDANSSGLKMDDSTFLRYLRARKFDFSKASHMLDDTIKFRKEYGLDQMHSNWADTITRENSTGKMYIRGFDRDGHVLLYMRPKHENTKDHDGNIKHLIYTMERALATMESSSTKEKLSLLIDFDGYSLSNAPPMKTSHETLNILQNHYPERLHRAYCLNPPWIFNAFWNVISPFIDPVTKDKIHMVKSQDLHRKLRDAIEPHILESSLGGEDSRPFVSSAYLGGDFRKDFWSILESEQQR
jgi:CRAL/TRIO domain/CRAL/TRIO, N-terminal domain